MALSTLRLQDENYLNWLRDSMALLFLKEGIEDFTDKRVSDLHADLLGIVSQQLSQQQSSSCNSCTHRHVKRYNRTWSVGCPTNVCNIWLKEILKKHTDAKNIARTNLKPQLWPSHPWEVAKCFLPHGSENVAAAKDTDVAAALKMMWSCTFMYKFFSDLNLVQEVLNIRHALMHSCDMNVSDAKLQDDTDKMIRLLKSLVHLSPAETNTVQKSIDSIIELRSKRLDVTLHKETIVLSSRMHAVESELATHRVKCSDYETNSRQDLTKSSEDLKALENDYKQTKAEMTQLQEIKDRFEEFLLKNDLTQDVAKLSTTLQEHGQKFDLLGQKFDLHDQRLSALEQKEKDKEDTTAGRAVCSWEEQCNSVQQYLIEIYQTKCLWENPMTTDQQCIPDIYVPPAVKLMREKDEHGGLEEVIREQSEPLHQSYQQIFSSRSGPCTNVYITGDAGTGKTTFCNQMALAWCEAVKTVRDRAVLAEDLTVLSHFKFLFYINLRDTGAIYHIEDMLKKFMKYAPFSVDIPTLLKTEKCLIVLDGLDEWSCPDETKCPGLNEHIPGRNIMNKNCVFLTTSRNWKYDVSDLKTKDVDKYIELCGISKKSSEELAQKLVGYLDKKSQRTTKTNIGTFHTEIHQRKLSDLITVPVLLIQLVTLWYCGKDFGNTQLQLYCSMLDLLFERSRKRMSEKQLESTCTAANKQEMLLPECFSSKDYCHSHAELLLCLSKLAYKSLFNKQMEEALVFKSSKLDIFGISQSDINLCLQCGILSQNKDFGNYTGKYKKLSFLHKTMQEFLAALHIVTVQPVEKTLECLREFCSSIDVMIEMSQVWLFVSGMSPDIMKQLLKHFTSVINADKRIQNYRQSLRDWSGERLIQDIQAFVADCVVEGRNNGHTYENIGLEDLYIDKHTFRHVERLLPGKISSCIKSMYIDDTGVMTVDQLRCITGLLQHSRTAQKLHLHDLESRITRETLTTFLQNCCNQLTSLDLFRVILTESGVTSICHSISECLMALRLGGVTLTHADKVKLLAGFSQSAIIKQLDLLLDCSDHDGQCRPRIDLSSMAQLQTLRLWFMCIDNLPTMTQCVERVYLVGVTFSVTTLCEFARRISPTKRHLKVTLDSVTVREGNEDHVDLETFLRGCPGLTVTRFMYYDSYNTGFIDYEHDDYFNTWLIRFHTNKQ